MLKSCQGNDEEIKWSSRNMFTVFEFRVNKNAKIMYYRMILNNWKSKWYDGKYKVGNVCWKLQYYHTLVDLSATSTGLCLTDQVEVAKAESLGQDISLLIVTSSANNLTLLWDTTVEISYRIKIARLSPEVTGGQEENWPLTTTP